MKWRFEWIAVCLSVVFGAREEVSVGVEGDTGVDERIPVIISTDPGVDDSLAIFTALASPKLNVLGIASSFGCHASPIITADNAKYLLEVANMSDIPVHVGTPFMMGKTEQFVSAGEFWHGKGGLGGYPVPAYFSPEDVSSNISSAEFIVQKSREYRGKVSILSFAPLTNIALAIALEPRLNQFVEHLYVMGGAIDEPGNISPVAEANFGNDALAARVVVHHFSGKITIAPLDVTHRVTMSLAERQVLGRSRVGTFMNEISDHYARMYKTIRGDEMPMHDTHAVMALIEPSVFTRVETMTVEVLKDRVGDAIDGYVLVEKRPNAPDRGIGSLRAPAEAKILLDADAQRFKKIVADLVATL